LINLQKKQVGEQLIFGMNGIKAKKSSENDKIIEALKSNRNKIQNY